MINPNLLYFALSCLILIISGVYLVKSLTKIARFLGISEFSAAFIIIAFATSIPELFVGISSAVSGAPALSLGNIIGANILNLTLISGIIILSAKKIDLKSRKINADVYFMLGVILLLIILFSIGKQLSRIDGIILLIIFSVHTYKLLKKKQKYKKNKKINKNKFLWISIFILSLIGLLLASSFIAKSAPILAKNFGVSEIIIGIFLISFATTIPELVFGVTATSLKHKEMAIGDQVGTIVTNIGLILGIVAIIHPITTELQPFLISSIFLLISGIIFYIFAKTNRELSNLEGIGLILVYVLFALVEFFVG